MRTIWITVGLTTLLGCSEPPKAAPPPSKVIEWTASPYDFRKAADGGAILDIDLVATVDPGWKLYSLTQKGEGPVPMTVKLDSASPYKLEGDIQAPTATRDKDLNFGIETETYSGTARFRVPVKLPVVVDASKPIELKVRSQACSDRLCLPAQTKTVPVAVPLQGT